MNFSRHPPFSAEQFTGAVGQHLVHIHIALGAGAGLPDSVGNSCACFPASTSSAAATIAPAFSAVNSPRSRLTFAAARGQRRAYISSPGIFRSRCEMLQRALGLGAQSLSAGTSMAPIESFSLRCVVITFSLDEKCVIATKLTCLKD